MLGRDPNKRYVRSSTTGDLGVLEEIDGKRVVVMPGRTGQPIAYREGDWYDDMPPRAMTLLQCAEVAHAADQRLQHFLGLKSRARRDWLSLTPEERLKFAEEGPHDPPLRRLIWRLIMRGLEEARKGS